MDKINKSCPIRIRKSRKLVVLISIMILFVLAFCNQKGILKPNAKSSIKIDKKVSVSFPELYYVNDGNIYYISLKDNWIYELNIYNGARQLISKNKANEMGFIYENGWIYYIGLEDFSLYRVNVDSKKSEEIAKNLLCSSENFLKYSGLLYYFDESGKTHRVNQDGSSSVVSEGFILTLLSRIKRYTKVSEEWVYTWDMFSIYRISIEGGEWEEVINNSYPLYEIYGDCIYYIDKDDFKLYKTNMNGMEKEVLCSNYVIEQGADFDGGNMVLYGDNLYHTAFVENGKARVYKINLKNGSVSNVSDRVVYFTIHEGSIYYMDDFDSGKLYGKKLENSYQRMLTTGGFIPYIDVKDGILFYGSKTVEIDDSEDGRIFVMDVDKELQFELK